MTEIANALNRVADAIFALNATIGLYGLLFLIFKKMSGHETIKVEYPDNKDNNTK